MPPIWFKARGYKHLDAPVGETYSAQASDPAFVATHSWSPLIHYIKQIKRYKPLKGKTVFKDRDIMYASHRDACILSKYAHDLTQLLDTRYIQAGIAQNVIAYRQLGRANYDFASEAHQFALANMPCVVMCFDVTGFFDNLDHLTLKKNLKQVLGVEELSADWYAVFRQVTKYRKIEKADLAAHPTFGPKMEDHKRAPIATISEINAAGIPIKSNENAFGVPQGTPISAAFSNLYMIDFDERLAAASHKAGTFYRRYSDDILVICTNAHEASLRREVENGLDALKLKLSADKTEVVKFNAATISRYQYLGFDVTPAGATIRAQSLSRQWRKLKRRLRRAKSDGESAISAGAAKKVFTRKLRKKFSPIGVRNFSLYARRASSAFESKKILSQIRRIEKAADAAIRELNE